MRRLDRLEAALPGLFLCGSYRGGVSVADCITSAHRIAERVRVTLRASSR
jgi:protoporphyrinogen oxidase